MDSSCCCQVAHILRSQPNVEMPPLNVENSWKRDSKVHGDTVDRSGFQAELQETTRNGRNVAPFILLHRSLLMK